jgi:hypothetical protein
MKKITFLSLFTASVALAQSTTNTITITNGAIVEIVTAPAPKPLRWRPPSRLRKTPEADIITIHIRPNSTR